MKGLLAALGVVLVMYGRSLRYGFVRDAEVKLSDALRLADIQSIWTGLFLDLSQLGDGISSFPATWRPTVNASYVIDALIGGGAPWAFHLSSMVALAVLAWSAGRAVCGAGGAAGVALLVACHPMQASAVLDVSARGDLLLALFGTLALTTCGRWGGLWTLLALGVSQVASGLPFLAMCLVRDRDGRQRGPGRWRWHLAAVALWHATRWGLYSTGRLWEGAIPIPGPQGVTESSVHALWYLQPLIMPFDPLFARLPPTFSSAWPGIAWAVFLVSVVAVLVVTRKSSVTKGPGLGMGLGVIALCLLGEGGLLSAGPGYGEGRLSWAVVGLAWMLASRASLRVGSWTLIPVWLAFTMTRVEVWEDPVDLWAESHAAVPTDTMVAYEYGSRLVERDSAKSVDLFEQVLVGSEIEHRIWGSHVGLIQAYLDLERDVEALPHLAVTADPTDPDNSWLLVQRCVLETRFGFEESKHEPGTLLAPLSQVCGEAAQRYPKNAALASAAGIEAAAREDYDRARSFFQRAVELDPHNGTLRRNFSLVPMNVLGWGSDEPLSPDPAAAP